MEAENANNEQFMPESSDRPLAYVETIKALNPIEVSHI